MKKLAIALLLIPVLSFSQAEETQTGKVELGNGGKNFFIKDGEGYKLNQYKEVFTNQEAIDRVKRARTNKTFASILTYTGSFCLGFGIGGALSNSEDPLMEKSTGWIIAAGGAGIMLSSIPLWMGYSKNIRKAVDLENGTTEESTAQLNLNINGNGVGLAYQF